MRKLTTIILITSFIFSGNAFSAVNTLQKMSPPIDLGVINKDRILYWLEKRGELSSNASTEEKQQAYRRYITKAYTRNNTILSEKLGKQMMQHNPSPTDIKANTSFSKIKSQLSKVKTSNLASKNSSNNVKVLAIMIDFQDLKYNNHGLQPNDTDMYYADYPKSHYQDLLFSTSGYSGPSQQNIESAYQYYQHESGETLSFTGNAFGWITADNDAKYYGANNNDENDSKVGELIIEAVTKAVAENNINLDDYDKTDYFDRDRDGIINEPDGVVDHIMIFHSSIGEESGGGKLGSDAIWSHRFFVFNANNSPINIIGSTTKIFGYTINPIDASTGVVVHEFGHDLGVPDEYDTTNTDIDSPVQAWSVMASGNWLGSPRGTKPSSFSPSAKEYFQNTYGGNWINQQTVTLSDSLNETLNITAATNHSGGINQIKINLPIIPINIGQPYTGSYQYYSNKGHLLRNTLTFDAGLIDSSSMLTMKARWDIEQDFDYVLVKANNQVIAANHTKLTNERHPLIQNFISGKSLNIAGALSPLGWIDLTYNLSDFANKNVTITIEYITDEALGGYGFIADDIKITSGSTTLFNNGAETLFPVKLNGFSRIDDTSGSAKHYYYVQLRNHTVTDSALSGIGYDPGVLLWYRNEGVDNNNVSQHAGSVNIGVVDADQTLIKRNNKIRSTEFQLRDAAFSLYDQTSTFDDTVIKNNAVFNDRDDYSSPLQPESGIKLPILGLSMEVVTQATDSATATILLTKNETNRLVKNQNGLSVSITIEDEDITNTSTFSWKMGDNTLLTGNSINHTYKSSGNYTVEVSYSTSKGNKLLSQSITVAPPIEGDINLTTNNTELTFNAILTGGHGDFIYRWNFGDSQGNASLLSGIYNYKNAGVFTVVLTIVDETGESYIFNKSVSIDNPLVSSFTSTKNNLIANFTSKISGGSKPYHYLWDFGDSQTNNASDPVHTYTNADTYTVTLTITDADNTQSSITNNITVNTATVTNQNNQTNNNSSSAESSGGSMHWLAIMFLILLFNRKRSV